MKLLKHYYTSFITTLFLLLFGQGVWGQTPNGTCDFGTTANGTTATTANTGFGGVRIGSAGGSFTIQNPGKTIGSQGELRGIAPTTSSINSVGLTSTEYGTATTTFTIAFDLHLSGGSSGIEGGWHNWAVLWPDDSFSWERKWALRNGSPFRMAQGRE